MPGAPLLLPLLLVPLAAALGMVGDRNSPPRSTSSGRR
jgi:hypothetical protein